MQGVRRVLTPIVRLHHNLCHSCGAGCCSHTTDDQGTVLRLPREVVYTNTGAQVDSENAPRVLHSIAVVESEGLEKRA